MAVRNPNRVSAVLTNTKMGAVIKPHLPLSQAGSAKKFSLAHLPLVPPRFNSKTILNRSPMPGGISRAENSILLRATQRRTGTRERHSTLSI